MSLQKILLDVAAEFGIDITNDTEKSYVIRRINDAAYDVYNSSIDLPGSLREQTFNIDTGETQSASLVSLPYYVDTIRGCKLTSVQGAKVNVNDMRPRYHYGRGWGDNTYALPIRIVRERVPLKRDISNASILSFTIPLVNCDEDIEIFVVGKTTNSELAQELVTIKKGELSAQTINNFVDMPINIEKSKETDVDIVITDIEGNELGVIANSELKPSYTILELQDSNLNVGAVTAYGLFSAVDILYKLRFTPFKNLFDEFPAPNCDRIIFYKFASYYEGQNRNNEMRSAGYELKCQQLIEQLHANVDNGKEIDLQFGPNGLLEAQNPRYRYYYGNSKTYGR